MPSCWTLLKYPLKLPHFEYMSNKLLSTKAAESHQLWMICSWEHLSTSRAKMLAQAFSNPTMWSHNFPLQFIEIVPVPSCPTFHMLQYHGGPSHHNLIPRILSDALQASSMLPHFT
jgi:hypothetical protein